MKRYANFTLAASLLLVVILGGCSSNSYSDAGNATAHPQQVNAETDDAKAIAEIENNGGKVISDKEHPGQVSVILGCKASDAELVHLKDLGQVRMLDLGSSHVTDAGLVHLKGLIHLEELDLAFTPVTDAGLAHLEGLTRLKRLVLQGTAVTDAGLIHLKGLTMLRWLNMGQTKVTYVGGVKGLRAALPNCTISFGSPIRIMVPSKRSDDEFLSRLLLAETVQKDLGLTEGQIVKIRDSLKLSQALWQEFSTTSNEVLPPGRYGQEEAMAREQKHRALLDDYERKGDELRAALLAMLTRGQSERLKQIGLQTAVARALRMPEIIDALQISVKQQEEIETVGNRLARQLTPPDLRHLSSKESREKMIQFAKESDRASATTNKLLLDVLTPEQRAKFAKLQGKQIEVTWPYDKLLPEDIKF